MRSPISRFTIQGDSMSPTLIPGQDILSFNWAYLGRRPKIEDIVVIKVRDREMVKRVQKVQGHQVFIQGDNKNESADSRHFGPVGIDQIVGKVVYSSYAQNIPPQ